MLRGCCAINSEGGITFIIEQRDRLKLSQRIQLRLTGLKLDEHNGNNFIIQTCLLFIIKNPYIILMVSLHSYKKLTFLLVKLIKYDYI